MCDETAYRLLEQRVENMDKTIGTALLTLSNSVDQTRDVLSSQIGKLEVALETKYVSKEELDTHVAQDKTSRVELNGTISALKEQLVPIKKIVYGAVSAILLAVVAAVIALVIR